jgi:hypothetical protein
VIDGNEVHLTCTLKNSGSIKPVMVWRNEHGRVMDGNWIRTTESQTESTLVLKVKYPALTAYTCEAHFEKIELKDTKQFHHARNAPEYRETCKSVPLLAKHKNENVALRKKATQSSTVAVKDNPRANSAGHAVDGNGAAVMSGCTMTGISPSVWWAVDLKKVTPIGRVRITTTKNEHTDGIYNFVVGLTNTSPWKSTPSLTDSTVCRYYTGHLKSGAPTNIYCDPSPTKGRYLFVLLNQPEHLTICELEAYYK